MLVAGEDEGDSRQILFCRDKNVEREIWDGFRYGPDAAREIFGFDEAYSIGDFPAKLADLTGDRPALYTPLGLYPHWDETITAALNEVRNRVRTGISAPETVVDVRAPLAAMRLYKDEQELPQIRRAAEISSGAHRRAMERTRPGLVRIPGRGRAGARVPALRRAGGRVSVDRRLRAQRLRAALSRQQPADAAVRSVADRCRLRVRGLRVGHHAHVPGRRQVQRPAEGGLRTRARGAACLHRRGQARARVSRLPPGGRARAGARPDRSEAVPGYARRCARIR